MQRKSKTQNGSLRSHVVSSPRVPHSTPPRLLRYARSARSMLQPRTNVILYTGSCQGARLEYDMLRSFRVHQSMSLIPASKTSPVPVRCTRTNNFEGLCVFQAYLRSTGHSSAIAIALTLMARQIDGGRDLPVFQCAPHATGISLSLAVQETLAFRLRRKGCPRGKT